MKPCAPFKHGASTSRSGFTLLEVCMVLFIIALMTCVALPTVKSAFDEQSVRSDSSQLAMMVKTAMLQSSEQHRAYVIELTATTMNLHPFVAPVKEEDVPETAPDDQDPSDTTPIMENVELASKLDGANKLMGTDPDKPKTWIPMPSTTWLFKPGELCPATRVRFMRSDAWLEMSFNPLTGNIEDEATFFP